MTIHEPEAGHVEDEPHRVRLLHALEDVLHELLRRRIADFPLEGDEHDVPNLDDRDSISLAHASPSTSATMTVASSCDLRNFSISLSQAFSRGSAPKSSLTIDEEM